MKNDHEPSVLKRDADVLGIDFNSAEYGYAVTEADSMETPEAAEAIARALAASQCDLNSGVPHG